MSSLMPNTMFKRLFLMTIAANLMSHILSFAVMFGILGHLPAAPRIPFPPEGSGFPPVPPINGILIFSVIQFAALGVAAWFGSKIFSAPIQSIALAASKLSEDLNSPPIEERGPNEAREAARIFNEMQRKIRNHIEERSRFLVAVSHDLRTPLTRLRLRIGNLSDEKTKDQLQQDVEEMSGMLTSILDFFRGEDAEETWQKLDVQALVEAVVEDLQEQGETVSVAGNLGPILSRPITLRRCLSNLVENALRYGEVARITLFEKNGDAVIEIRDEGPGIPEDKMTLVFEPFVRLEGSRNKTMGGIGLGLAIARDAAKKCGGKVELRNGEKGLLATITLPVRT